MAESTSIPHTPRTVHFSPQAALEYYRQVAEDLRKYVGVSCLCRRDGKRARDLAHTYDKLADACEKAVRS